MQTRGASWTARGALVVVMAMYAGFVGTVFPAAGQTTGAPLVAVGVDLVTASTTQATYEFFVTNQGSATATAVRVNSAVPANTTFEESTPASVAGTGDPIPPPCDNQGVREGPGTSCNWTVPDLPPGASATISATYNLNQADVASFTVSLTAQVTQTEEQTSSNTDATLKRDRLSVRADTFVDDTAPANTNHGACNRLRVKKDNTTTSFIDFTGAGALANVDTFWNGQLRATVEFTDFTAGAPGGIGVHRITPPTDPIWTEGAGTCAGIAVAAPAAEARTGAEPASAAVATNIAVIMGTEQIVNWDVTADLDSSEERATSQGWELKDAGSSGTGTLVELDSKETTNTAQVPRLFLVYSVREPAACVDVDPEADINPPTEFHRLDAYVTDGGVVGTREAGSAAEDGCSGNPVTGAQVLWTIEDDDPDAWISNQNGSPTTKTIGAGGDAQPNAATTSTDAAGRTFIDIQLDEPSVTGQNSGDDRISGRVVGTEDVPEEDEPEGCADPIIPCGPGEAVNEDDVIKTWDPAATTQPTAGQTSTPTPTDTGTPTPTPTGEPECSDGIDNDDDGFIDHPDDAGCDSPTDDSEAGEIDQRCNEPGVMCGTDGNDVLVGTAGPDLIICGDGTDLVDAAGGDDTIECDGTGAKQIDGGSGNDSMVGGSDDDICDGQGGDDVINCGPGNDTILGGPGDDSLRSTSGNDTIKGGSGNDILRGGSGDDVLRGGSGKDTLRGGGGDDSLGGGGQNDTLVGGSGNDTIKGNAGADTLRGGSGKDTLRGGGGNDVLRGGKGRDTLKGGKGGDTLNGGGGKDTCGGGSGKDKLRNCE